MDRGNARFLFEVPMNIFLRLSKIDAQKREVWGTMTQELLDKSGEVMDYASSKPNFEKWSNGFREATAGESLGNVREMHGASAVGKLIAMQFDDSAKKIDVGAKIVDDAAWKKVQENVYTGFSIGGGYEKRWEDGALKRYTAMPAEVSLVDNPCLQTATYTMVKSDGIVEERHFSKVATRPDVDTADKKEAERKYGNVTYADEKNKKYPLDTAAHVRAAASYFGMPKNRAQYDAADIKTIQTRIDAAEKKFGIGKKNAKKTVEDAIQSLQAASLHKLADPLLAAHGFAEMNKGLYDVASLAISLQGIHNAVLTAQAEQAQEGDDSKVPAMLAEVRDKLSEALVSMAEEETEELNPTESEDDMTPTEKMAKALALMAEVHGEMALNKAVTGKEHKEALQKIHDHTVAMGAGHNDQHDEELKKDGWKKPEEKEKDKPEDKNDESAEKMMKTLLDRIAALEGQPAAPKGASPVVVAVSKDADNEASRAAAVKKDMTPLDLVKEAARNAVPLTPDDLMKLAR